VKQIQTPYYWRQQDGFVTGSLVKVHILDNLGEESAVPEHTLAVLQFVTILTSLGVETLKNDFQCAGSTPDENGGFTASTALPVRWSFHKMV